MILSLLLSILMMPGVALAEGGVVTGTLRVKDGGPAARVRVGVMSVPEPGRGVRGAGTLVSQVETDDAGRFRFEGVPPGRYYIVAGKLQTPTFYPGVRDMGTAKTIEVAAKATVRDIDFAVVTLSPDVDPTGSLPVVRVTGRIVLKNNPNASMPSSITFQSFPDKPATNPLGLNTGNTGLLVPASVALAALANPPVVPRTTATVPIAQDGVFKIDLFGADQRLSVVGLPTGYSVVSMTSGGRNLLTQAMDVKPGAELIVSLDVGDPRPRYRLMALVRDDSSDRPLSGERIELVHASGEVVRFVNAQGLATFPDLLPGTYVLRLASAGFDVPERQVVLTNSSAQVELRARRKP
jgi:hypothetical protein